MEQDFRNYPTGRGTKPEETFQGKDMRKAGRGEVCSPKSKRLARRHTHAEARGTYVENRSQFFHRVEPRDQTQGITPGNKRFHMLLYHLAHTLLSKIQG